MSIGRSINRVDALTKVTGREKFIDDYTYTNQLHGAVLRSPYARARIVSIDATEAMNLPGVTDVLTHKDIRGKNEIEVIFKDLPALAEDEVRYVGDSVALVAAETREIAYEALKHIKVEYEVLPPVLDMMTAMDPQTPRIHKDINYFNRDVVIKGRDPEEVFDECFFVIEKEYTTSYQEHAYLETQGMIAVPESDGGITVYGSMQCPFYIQIAVAAVLDLPFSLVKIIQTTVGGGFGGKEDIPSQVAVQAALMAQKTGRPVKLVLNREEDITAMTKRHPSYTKIKIGVDKEGHILAGQAYLILDSGAYSTITPAVLGRAATHLLGAYRCPNVNVESYAVVTNKVPTGAFRGFGAPQGQFPIECLMDIIAQKVGLDPAEIRRRNILILNDKTITGQVIDSSIGALEAFDITVSESEYFKKREQNKEWNKNSYIKKGIGLATVIYGVGLESFGFHHKKAGSFMQIYPDGSAVFAVGTVDMGQGMITVLTQIVSQALGIKVEKIRMLPTDTSRVPDSGPTVASRSTTMSGNSLLDAAKPLTETMAQVASEMMGVNKDEIEFVDGLARTSKKSMKLDLVINECHHRKLKMVSTGYYTPPKLQRDRETGQGDAYMTYTFSSNVAEVEVNTITGEVNFTKFFCTDDVGKAINPRLVEGQIEGGTVQGGGYALLEQIYHDANGKILNNSLSTYIIPTSKDVPEIKSKFIEMTYPRGPYGAKGFGELPLIGVAPAVINAIYDATGVRLDTIPALPEKVLKALKDI